MSDIPNESNPLEFQETMRRAINGSQEDIQRLISKYGDSIQKVVRRRLDTRLRSKFDSLDFVQMVWASFFRDSAQLERFGAPEAFVRFLVTMAKNKVIDEGRRRLTGARYNCTKETAFDDAQPLARPALDTPSQVAIAHEQLQMMFATESERDQKVINLKLNGASFVEISEALGINERTARRIVGRLAPRKT